MTNLRVDIDHRLGNFHLQANFACQGRLTALFGQSGSGKTSIVNAIAGLLRPDRAIIEVGGATLVDTSAGVFVPAWRRHIGYVFQEARLFPHMNVRQNLLYAQWFGGRKDTRGASLDKVVDLLGIEPLLRRYPSRLSGGEKQRVAIGRALLSHPRLLLMDEPLASLDEARKQEIMPYLERLRDSAAAPVVYVSHSIEEVKRLADWVVMIDGGRVTGAGPPADMLGARNAPPADANVLDVRTCAARADGLLALGTAAGELLIEGCDASAPRAVIVAPSAVVIVRDAHATAGALNTLQARVLAVVARDGVWSDVRVRAGEADLVARAPRAFADSLAPGEDVRLIVTSAAPV